MLYTIEALARRWGMDRREVLRLGTDPRGGLQFVVAVDKVSTVTMLDPGRKDVDRLTDPLYAPKFKKTSGLFHVPADTVAAILSTGAAELGNAIPGEWAHVREILMLELQAGIISLTMFRPPLPVTVESLLVTDGALSAFEALNHGLMKPANESDATLGAAIREQRQEFAIRNQERSHARQAEWERWRAKAAEIQAGRTRKASKRELAERVKVALTLPDSIRTIRQRL